MNRRKFINNSIKACASTLLMDGFVQKTFAKSYLMQAVQASCNENILVLVQLSGGNDGLNTIIPLDQYKALSTARANILIPESKVLATTQYPATGFHPSMSGLYNLFQKDKLSIVQGCSYEKPDFSHFRANDIWLSGSDSNEYMASGWLGRQLEEMYQGYPIGYPNNNIPDPLAIQMGSSTSLALDGRSAVMGTSVSNITQDYSLFGGFGDAAPNTRAGKELSFIRGISVRTDKYNERILAAANAQKTNLSTLYAGDDALSTQLKNVARLIKGGLQTKIYMVYMGGFDTHASQTDSSDTTKGVHATLLDKVSKAISGFQDDIEKMGINKRVAGMVFSEFGRRIKSNGSQGTDHGSGMPVMVFGSELTGSIYGKNPIIPVGATSNDNVAMQYDYRSVYYSILKDWFCLSKTQLSSIFGGKTYPYLTFFKTGSIVTNSEDLYLEQRTNKLADIYPNPAQEVANISFNSSGGTVLVELLDMYGNQLSTIMEKEISAGAHQVKFERGNLNNGIYLVRMRNGTFQETKKVVLK